MNILMGLRNLIQVNDLVAFVYNLLGATPFYRVFIKHLMKKRLSSFQTKRDLHIFIEVCSICNARCVFCQYPDCGRPLQRMPDEIFEKIMARLKEEDINPPIIELHMLGEPFLDPNIFKKVDRLHQAFPLAVIKINSNFNSVTGEILEALLDSPVNLLNISLNAANPDTYQQLMGLDYQRTVNNINRLLELRALRGPKQKHRLQIQTSIVLCSLNRKEKWKFIRQWWGKVDSLRLQRVSPWTPKIKDQRSKWIGKRNYYPCADIFTRMPIFSNGDYGLCCQDASGIVHKNVMDTKILDAFNGEVFTKIRQAQLAGHYPPMCEKCLMGGDSNGGGWMVY